MADPGRAAPAHAAPRVDFDPAGYRPAADRLAGRVVLVTGAGAGLGCAAAEALGACGATVVLLGRSVRRLEAVYDRIEAAGGPEPAIYPLDLERATYQDFETLAATLEDEFGRLDGLLHNAAMLGDLAPIASFEPTVWARVLQVDLHAPFMLTQVALPLLGRAADAALVFVLDPAVAGGRAYWGAYAAAKAGLAALAITLAEEHESRAALRVNALDPGPMASALRRSAFPAEDPRALPPPAAIAPACVYLLGPDSRPLNGVCLRALPGAAATGA